METNKELLAIKEQGINNNREVRNRDVIYVGIEDLIALIPKLNDY